MKKKVFLSLLVLVLAFGFIGCGDDDDPPTAPVPTPTPTPTPTPNPFLGGWVYEYWDELHNNRDGMAFLFKDDGTVSVNGGFATGTYNHNTTPTTLSIPAHSITANISVSDSILTITGTDTNFDGPYAKGGLLTLTDAPETNYRFYISATPWISTISEDLMTGAAMAAIKAFVGRIPCGNDIASGTVNPIWWDGSTSGTYHVLIRAGAGNWKYKNDVTFENGNNTTVFGFSEMTTATYSGGGD